MLKSHEIEKVCRWTLEAGTLLQRFAQDPEYRVPQVKVDGSPVTKADLEVSDFLVKSLKTLGYPVVSEEGALLLDCQGPYFLVDPLDGTKHFVAGKKDYAVLVGFVENQQPVFGCISSPEDRKLYWAQSGQGCFLNGDLLVRPAPRENAIVAYSSGFHKNEIRKWVTDWFAIKEIKTRGSALKFCDIAEGVADFFPRFGPTGEWDTAAAQVILQECQCVLIDMKSRAPITYGKSQRLNSGFIACHQSLWPQVERALAELQERREEF